jgi:hypothetical protein
LSRGEGGYVPEYISRWTKSSDEELRALRIEKEENEVVERWSKRGTLLGDFCKVRFALLCFALLPPMLPLASRPTPPPPRTALQVILASLLSFFVPQDCGDGVDIKHAPSPSPSVFL